MNSNLPNSQSGNSKPNNTKATPVINPTLPNSQSGNSIPDNTKATSVITHVSSGGKEVETKSISQSEVIQVVPTEVEIPKEVEKAGVQKISESIELPLDIKNMGVTSTPPPAFTVQTNDLSQIELPITDQQVVVGLHQDITSAFRWLAVWCIHKLHKAHIILKVVHGKIRRVKD